MSNSKTTKTETLETVTPSLGRRIHKFFGRDAVKTAAYWAKYWRGLGYSVA